MLRKKRIWKRMAAAGAVVFFACCPGARPSFAAANLADGAEYEVSGPEECRRLLMEVVSSARESGRYEFFVTGLDYEPETLVIAQMFPDVINISNTKLEIYREGGHEYTVCRVGFEWKRDPSECEHVLETEVLEESGCLKRGMERSFCRLCGFEERTAMAALGHTDGNGDSLCDRCQETFLSQTDGETEKAFWAVGDIQLRKLGKNSYRFRCIDDDYRDSNSNYQRSALFLCETVIRSDIDSTDSKREVLVFGDTNEYKKSEIREWLARNAAESAGDVLTVFTGVNSAYEGMTKEGGFGQTTGQGLTGHSLPFQLAEDRLFLLSLEEALDYREELWEPEGAGSPYSRGYWLRTPAFHEGQDSEFINGVWEYVVDLERGCLRPAEVSDTAFGIRPAYCLPQA